MGASESKLTFKQGVFKLHEGKTIPADDLYWTGFWQLPESTEDLFTLFSANDIRRTRDRSIANLETLILAITSRLFYLRNHRSFPDTELAPEREALNCVRTLTRILPFVYESTELEAWEEKFLWGKRRVRVGRGASDGEGAASEEANPDTGSDRENLPEAFEEARPLAEELLDTLVDLLFFEGFTVPQDDRTKSKVTYQIWTSGVGHHTAVSSNARFESNRTEVLRLLLTLTSKSMYMPANVLPIKGVRAITYLVTCPDKQTVLSMLCSLLNTAVKFNPTTWRIPYDHVVVGDPKQLYIASSLQLLLVLLLYPVPEDGNGPQKNFFRHFLGRLHRPQDFQFLCDGISRTLHQPLSATSSYLPGSQRPVRWAPEMIMLFWEAIQSNRQFRTFIVDSDKGYDFIILMLSYAIENRMDPLKQGIVRMCIFVLQTLSVEEKFGARLNEKVGRPESLPSAVRIDNWQGTYGDFLIVSIHNLITGSKGKLDAIYPALLAILNNVAAYLENLNPLSCLKLLQLYSSMSSPRFLLANETNHTLLTSLLELINAVVEHKYEQNRPLATYILKSRKRFQSLRNFTLENGQEELERMRESRKEGAGEYDDLLRSPTLSSRANSLDSSRSPGGARTPALSNVPEENSAFAVGDDESDTEDQSLIATPSASSTTFRSSRSPSIDSSVDSSVPAQLRGMSEKARGKMPAGAPPFARVNSSHSISSNANPTSPSGFSPTPEWIESWLPTLPLHTILTLLSASPDGSSPPPTLPAAIDPAPPRIHSFEWTPLSLGWYESLLWSLVFRADMGGPRGGAGSGGGGGSGGVGVWNGTAVRLFRVEREAARGPSLMNPGGAVDAVGSSIVQRIGGLNLRSAAAGAVASARGAAGGADGAAPRQAPGRVNPSA